MSVLDLKDVSKIFGEGSTRVAAVDGVDLQVAPGEVVLIMGPSGSGKTTLLSLAGCLLKPSQGQVLLNGEDVTGYSEGNLPAIRLKNIGFVFQSFNLLSSLTALENVETPLRLAGKGAKEAKTAAVAQLNELGLGERLHFLPSKLSGGEKQRVAIARALANDPALILADEPTANLDSRSGQLVVKLLTDLAKKQGKSVVIVSHDTRIQGIADRVLWLEDGRLLPKVG